MKNDLIKIIKSSAEVLQSIIRLAIRILQQVPRFYRYAYNNRPERWKKNGKLSYYSALTFVLFCLLTLTFPLWLEPTKGLRFTDEVPQVLSFTPQCPDTITPMIVSLPETGVRIEAKVGTEYLPDGTDLNRLAYAVARAETDNCKKGFGKEYNNCFGIRDGNTAPCPKVGRSNMCIYETPEDSYRAFKTIWKTHYKAFPNYSLASRYTGNDRASTWIKNITYHYEKN